MGRSVSALPYIVRQAAMLNRKFYEPTAAHFKQSTSLPYDMRVPYIMRVIIHIRQLVSSCNRC